MHVYFEITEVLTSHVIIWLLISFNVRRVNYPAKKQEMRIQSLRWNILHILPCYRGRHITRYCFRFTNWLITKLIVFPPHWLNRSQWGVISGRYIVVYIVHCSVCTQCCALMDYQRFAFSWLCRTGLCNNDDGWPAVGWEFNYNKNWDWR